jgi:hypothetical protein
MRHHLSEGSIVTRDQIKLRVEKTKNFVKSHAPQTVTACAAVLGVLLMRSQLSATKKVLKETRTVRELGESEQRAWADHAVIARECIAQGRDFDIYPGVGVYVHPVKKNQPQD